MCRSAATLTGCSSRAYSFGRARGGWQLVGVEIFSCVVYNWNL